MNITTEDILDSLMRVALDPPVTSVTDANGNSYLHSEPSMMQPIVNAIVQRINNDAELKDAIVAQVVATIPNMIPAIHQRILGYVVEEHVNKPSYGGGPTYTKAVIAKWAEEPIQAALLEALRSRVMEHVDTDLPLEAYDVNITVNLVPKGTT